MDFIKAYRFEKVTDNQVLLLYRDHAPDNEIIDYGIRYGLMEEEQGHHLLRFYRDPLSRSYTYNYTLGRDLIAEFLAKTGRKAEMLRRLLYELFTPTQILQLLGSRI